MLLLIDNVDDKADDIKKKKKLQIFARKRNTIFAMYISNLDFS